ncbi:MAG: hypothetical protein M0036_11255 [Desulfobacteraceae bacterium]|nr:hypothetical protein [Desulfobacteraceae bacterium]
MKKLVLAVFLFICAMTVAGTAVAESLREQFVAMKNVDSVWAVDKYYTVLYPKRSNESVRTDDFALEFIKIVGKYGSLEIKTKVKDTFTDKEEEKWVPLEFFPEKSDFKHPVTGEKISFLVNPYYYYRVSNEFVIENYLSERAIGNGDLLIKKISIFHSSPQSTQYKSEIVKNIDLAIPNEGEFSKKPFSRGFLKGFQSGDLMQYMVLLAEKWGTGKYIINSSEGLKEVNPYSFYEYLDTTPSEKELFFFFCDNPQKPFVIKAKNSAYEVFHRTLEGISYKPLSGSMAAAGAAAAAAAPKPQSIPEGLAMEAVTNKSDFESNPKPSEQYKVLYYGIINGCEAVTVQKYFATSGAAPAQPIETFDYAYCNGQLNQLPVEFVSQLPGDVDRLVPQVARKAQQEGQARASYTNYIVNGRALRDRAECRVQIRIFKGQKFVEERIVNGCAGQ